MAQSPLNASRKSIFQAVSGHKWGDSRRDTPWGIEAPLRWLSLALVLSSPACGTEPDSVLEQVRSRQQAGELAETIAPLRELLREAPDDPELNHLYGVALLAARQPELAIWSLRKAAEHPERAVEDGLLLTRALLLGGSPDDAVDQALRVLELAPDRVDVVRTLLKARLKARKNEDALLDATRLLALEPDDPEGLLSRLLALLALERVDEADEALATLRTAMHDLPEGSEWLPRICAASATFAQEKGDASAADSQWSECLEQFPAEEIVVSGAIEFYSRKPGQGRALEILRNAHEAKPQHLAYIEALANRLDAAGRHDEALTLLRAATHDGVNDARAWFALARYHTQRDETLMARDAMGLGLGLIDEAPATLVAAYADLLIRSGDFAEAEELIERFEPSPVMQNMLRGRLFLAQGQPERALEALEEGLRLWPDHSVARWLAGNAAMQLGDFDRALTEYGEAVRNDPSNRDAVLSLVTLFEALGVDREAIPILSRYHNEVQHDPELLVRSMRIASRSGEQRLIEGAAQRLRQIPGQRGVVAAELAAIRASRQGPAAAIEFLQGAPGLDLTHPQNGPALELLVEYLVAEGRAGEAAQAVDRALAAHPTVAGFHALRGRALAGAGEPAARRALERALELEPENAAALAALAELVASAGDREAALALYDRAIRAEPEQVTHAWAAVQLAEANGDRAALVRRLEELLAARQTHAPAAELLAKQLLESNPERALAMAQRAVRFRGGASARDTQLRALRHPGG